VYGALNTDLYEIAMAAGYHHVNRSGRTTFELFVRSLGRSRGYLVSGGLEQALAYLEQLRFTAADIAYLRTVPALARVPETFFTELLPSLRFRGDVWAVSEGEPVFANEPILRVTAAAIEAQLVETALLALINFQTAIASKGARIVHAARGRRVVEFGARRAHGLEAGVLAARAAYIAGCVGTSNVEAGRQFGIPVSGTMAHSWVMGFEHEIDAFRSYEGLFGRDATLLIDTYDTERAAQAIVAAGLHPASVRLDSGDLLETSRNVRRIFDAGGLTDTRILASGDLDEFSITNLLDAGAPIDAFGVGTALSTSADAPALGGVYKLVEIEQDGRSLPVVKLSQSKQTLAGAKQVWRTVEDGSAVRDYVSLADESGPSGSRPLLVQVMRDGRRITSPTALSQVREYCLKAVGELSAAVRRITNWDGYEVSVSERVQRVTAQAAGRLR
jgi:nicotinate phosphoribosyltransferase